MRKIYAKGLGYSPNNEISKELNRMSWNKMQKNIEASDAWRKELEKDPSIENRMSFVEFKREYFSKKKRKYKK
jgi:hypothetical protein